MNELVENFLTESLQVIQQFDAAHHRAATWVRFWLLDRDSPLFSTEWHRVPVEHHGKEKMEGRFLDR
jgi:hypothetical protein